MVHPKYNPQEALEKIKLMMKYDSSKTLNENKQTISEDVDWKGVGTTAGVTAASAGLGTAAVATPLATTAAGSTALVGVSEALGVSVFAAGGIIAGAAALALTPLVYWLVTKDNAKGKVEKALNYCKTDATKVAKLERGVDDRTIRDLSDQLYDAMQGLGTDEEKIANAFKSLKTASDLCALVDRFSKDWGSEGDLLEWLDSDIDSDTDWNKIYIPIRNVVEDSLLSIKDETVEEDCKKNPNQAKCGGSVKSKYSPCSGTYKLYCSSDVIAKVQGCLGGLVQDGKFGPKTQAKLSEKFPNLANQFTDSDVDTICVGAKEEEVVSDEEQVSDVNVTNY